MTRRCRALMLFCAVSAAAVSGAITVREVPSGRSSTVPSVDHDGELMLALPLFLERLGFKWQWDEAARQLTCSRNMQHFIFTQDIPYYSSDNALLNLPQPPERIGASLFLPLGAILDIGKAVSGISLRWNPASNALTVNKSSYSVASVACEKKQNGMLITIDLADSLPFDYTYYYPNVALNFFGATIDTAQVRSGRRIGFVDSVYGVQFNESAQLSLIVTREIEEPQIDYLEDLHTLLVSLRPRKPAAAAEGRQSTDAMTTAGIRTIVIDPGVSC